MAITSADCVMWRELRRRHLIPERPTVLEIGKANWYGDVSPAEFHKDIEDFGTEADKETPHPLNGWTVADWYYRVMLRNPVRTAIDLDPAAEGAQRVDLNWIDAKSVLRPVDVIINTGTAEHVFSQGAVWRTMHEACKTGGLMVHALPLWGWLDHGFYNYHPTFVTDLAVENGYEILYWLFAEIEPAFHKVVTCPADLLALYPRSRDKGAMMHVAYRKTSDVPFRVPMQGVYTNRTTAAEKREWVKRR